MDRIKAIKLCKEKYQAFIDNDVWEIYRLPDGELKDKIKNCCHYCPLCEYVWVQTRKIPFLDAAAKINSKSCRLCPLVQQYGHNCEWLGYLVKPREFAEKYVINLKEE